MISTQRNTRSLKFLMIAVAIMVCVMSILAVIVYKSPQNKFGASDLNLEATRNIENTIEAIVEAAFNSTLTPIQPNDEGLVNGSNEEVIIPTESELELGTESVSASNAPPIQEFTPTASSIPSATPQPTKAPVAWVEEKLASMSRAQKVGQMILTGVDGTELTPSTCQFIRRVSPGGIIYIGSNISSPNTSQLNTLSQGLQNCISESVGIPLLISIDHEGPYVNRFPYESQMTTFPPAMAFGATMKSNFAYKAAFASGTELRTNGVNMVLGPVADVLTELDNTVISQRSYGGDPYAVSLMVSGAVQGYLEAGVLPVLKHYPGHGGVSGDSHTVLPVDYSDNQTLHDVHLVPFKAGIDTGAPGVMMSHVSFPAVDSQNLPASLSEELYGILNDELDFHGIAMSDSMGMGAVSSTGLSVEAASIKAVNAGLDMLMLVSPNLAESVYNSVLDAVKNEEISAERIDQAVRRILTVKYEHGLAAFPLQERPLPDWNANRNLSDDIGYQAVSLYKNTLNLVPLSKDVKKVLIVGPTDGWGLYSRLGSALAQKGISYSTLNYSAYWYGPIPETSLLQTVPARAENNDLVIVFTWDSHPNLFLFGDTFQAQLVNALLDGGHQPVVIALKSPSDYLDFQRVSTYLAAMGTTPGQLDALVRVLVGDDTSKGTIPLPNLP
jgi:beta-N-acetylhexosaminidase